MSQDIWLTQARACPSPNFNDRPSGEQPSLLVIHSISLPPGQYGGPYVENFFLNKLDSSQHPYFSEISHLQVSAHFFIDRKGVLTQFVAVNKRAWHAGESSFCGRANCNDFSIGIELEGCEHEAYSDEQYGCLVALSVDLRKRYPEISLDRIVGHSDIAPGRKTDPGPSFDWERYRSLLTG